MKLKPNEPVDPREWADLFARSGARFAGPVAEHHDGFSMWASDVNPWNAKYQGPGIDLVGVLFDAFRESGMKIILSMHHAFLWGTGSENTARPFTTQGHGSDLAKGLPR